MKINKHILFIIMGFIILLVVLVSGCITKVPFELTTETISLILAPPLGIYGESTVYVPDEAREKGVEIESSELVYSVKNLSPYQVNAKLYVSLTPGSSKNGELIFQKTIEPYETIKGNIKSPIITKALHQDKFYIGAELSNSVSLEISGYLNIYGKYDILAGWY